MDGLGNYQGQLYPAQNKIPVRGPTKSPLRNPRPDCDTAPPINPADAARVPNVSPADVAKLTLLALANIECLLRKNVTHHENTEMLSSINNDLLSTYIIPKYAIPFQQGIIPTVVSPVGQGGSFTSILTLTTDEGWEGFITEIGLATYPSGAGADIDWRVLINDRVVPKFDDQSFMVSSLGNPMKVQIPAPSGCVIKVQAINNGALPLYTSVIIKGWTAAVRRM